MIGMIGRTQAPRPRLQALISLAGALACIGGAGCVILPDQTPVTIDAPPLDQYEQLGLLMGKRCGTLDCHGQIGRNLRIYSADGLRLPPNTPGSPPKPTTDEIDADYASAISLEPEIMSLVVQQQGAEPDRLTLVRKPRAEENHAGGQIFAIGDPQDKCMTSWLASNDDPTDTVHKIDSASCTTALMYP
jgi:hypothetical protein